MPHADPLSKEAVLEVLQDLIRIPSVNPTLAPGECAGEAEIAEFARAWLADRGLKSWTEEVAPGRANAVGEAGEGGPALVLCAHLDTVSTAGMTIAPFDPAVEDGRVYGRGSYDMKGSAAALMSAAAALASEGIPRGRLLVALVADEEYASIGAQDFVRRHPADACILTEPSEGKLILAHKGFVWIEIVTRGRAAHGSRWDLGVSAIGRMGRIIAALEDFDRRELRARVYPLVGPASQHCALVQGGAGLSTYAPECRMQVERRTLPGETPEQVLDEIRAVIDWAGEEAEVTLMLDRPPLVCDRDAAVSRCVREAALEETSCAPVEAGVGYWMDAALFAQAGIPTVDYGPAGAGAHEAVEWVELESVVQCARVLSGAARRFFAA